MAFENNSNLLKAQNKYMKLVEAYGQMRGLLVKKFPKTLSTAEEYILTIVSQKNYIFFILYFIFVFFLFFITYFPIFI